MTFRAAIALIALAVPVFSQRGGAGAGPIGSHGSAGHAGFPRSPGFSSARVFSSPAPRGFPSSAPRGFSSPGFSNPRSFASPAPRGFSSPAPRVLYGAPGVTGIRRDGPSSGPIFRAPYNGNRTSGRDGTGRNPAGGGRSHNGDRRGRHFDNRFRYIYPGWPGYSYPYLLDPGFYNWGDSDSSYDQSDAASPYAAPDQDEGYSAPDQPPAAGTAPSVTVAASAPPAPEQPLTIIFKDGRAPVKVQNYMMTASALTDLDAQHYEQIPLNQIDMGATRRVNGAAGVDFQIPDNAR